jgi:hypothetical protein
MTSESDRPGAPLAWHEYAALLLETVPGVVSASVAGTRQSVTEVRVWYEPTWPLDQVLHAVYRCLAKEAKAHLAATRFRAVVARPDRRTARRARPERAPAATNAPGISPEAPLKLAGYKVERPEGGVVAVQVWIDWQGRTFTGAAVGPADPAGSLRTPALATLRALHACLQVLYEGPRQPGLVLESAVRVQVDDAPVVVVALTAAENSRPRTLTSAWADEGMEGLAAILATIHATQRTVTRWLMEGQRSEEGATERRVALVDFEFDHGPSGELDVGVRLEGFGNAVGRRRNGSDNEAAHMQLGASATLDAVCELLRLGGWDERQRGDLGHARTYRLRTAEQDIVVVLAEAILDGRRVALAGATSADAGLERASITATLQATNPLVAGRAGTLLPVSDDELILVSRLARA